MAKVVVNVRNNDLTNLKDNDILMYDEKNDAFYRVTPEKFFSKYETKLNALLEKYDKQFLDLKHIFEVETKKMSTECTMLHSNLEKTFEKHINNSNISNEKFKTEIKKEFNNLLVKNRNTIDKLIIMVEQFIKGGK